MSRYPKYATTVIGAHSVPDWYEALDRLVAVGQLALAAMADAQFRCTEAAILDQELAGIDVVTGGEMHRRTHNRHSPPNAMLNYFWQKIARLPGQHAAQADHAARSRRLPSRRDLPRPASPDTIDLGLVDEFNIGLGADAQAGQDHHDRAAHAVPRSPTTSITATSPA